MRILLLDLMILGLFMDSGELASSFLLWILIQRLQDTRYPGHEMLIMDALLGRTTATVASISSVTPRGIIATYP